MVNDKVLTKKVVDFFNSLSAEETIALRKMTMTKKWQSYFESRIYNQKIEL